MQLKICKRVLTIAAGVLIINASLSGCTNLVNKPQKSTLTKVSTSNVSTEKVFKGDINVTIQGIGIYVPIKSTSLFFKEISGPLKKISVRLGDEVKAGQPIAEIDNQDLIKDINDKEMSLQLNSLRKQQIDENIKTAELILRQAEISKETTEKRYSVEQSYLTQSALDSANIQYEQAVSGRKNALLSRDISEAQYKIDLKNLNNMKENAGKSKLIVPIDGMVVFVDKLSETEIVPSGRVLVKVSEPKHIVFQISSFLAKNIHDVKKATLVLSGENYEVELYEPQPGDQLEESNSFNNERNKIYLSFTGKKPEFKINENYDATLILKKSNVFLAPKALMRMESGKTFLDVMRNNQIETVELVTGLEKDDKVEVLSGLNESDSIVIR